MIFAISKKIKIVVIFIFYVVLFVNSSSMAHDRFALEFKDTEMLFDERTNKVQLFLKIKNYAFQFSARQEWDIKKVKEDIFNVQFKRWKGYYWQVDLKNKQIFKVTKGNFNTALGTREILQDIQVNFYPRNPGEFILRFPSVSTDFRSEGGNKFLAQDSEILGIDEWTLTKEYPYTYDITAQGRGVHWKVDLSTGKVTVFTYNGTEIPYDSGLKIHETDVKSAAMKKNEIKESAHTDVTARSEHSSELQNAHLNILNDITMANMTVPYPKSEWLESEKEFNRELLKKSSYDVLVVPFQVQGYAIDRVGRSLMTRYIADRISLTTGARTPDTTLVERAFGENDRRFDENRIFALADDLKVKVLIRGYVGHNRDEKMSLTFLIQEREGMNKFSPKTKTVKLTREDIPFSDTSLPSEAFLKILDDIMSKMPFRAVNSIQVHMYDKVGDLPLPEKISSMIASKDTPPVINAFYLQLLGILYPEQTTAKEHVFEKSLATLSSISPESPDYPLLKARAYFYLHRRPAAMSVLGEPSTPEGKAFRAFLNGNLTELAKWTNEIRSPFLKLLSQIELDDLRTSYRQIVYRETYEKIIKELPDEWAMLVTNRLHVDDGWYLLSNLEVKEKMDEVFPVEGFTAKNLIMGKAVIGESPAPGDEADLSVYNHYHRYLMEYGDKICCMNRNGLINGMDYMDLLYAVGESNLLKMVRMRLQKQYLPENALDILNKLDAIYRGHPGFTYLKVLTLRELSDKNQGQARANMVKRYKEDAYKVYLWAQGQTRESSYMDLYILGSGSSLPVKPEYYFYEADYPRRHYWFVEKGDRTNYRESFLKDKIYSFITDSLKKDIQNWEIALRYSNDDINPLEGLYNALMNLKDQYKDFNKDFNKNIDIDIAAVLKSNQNRFAGHPGRDELFAKAINKTVAEKRDFKKDLEENIGSNPEAWKPYFEAGKLYLREGDFKKALAAFQRYPLFRKQNEQMVRMSNCAYEAGLELLWNSAVDESIPLLKLAAGSDTGSGAEMASAALLALLEGDYNQAAYHYMQAVQRYGDNYDVRDYLLFLHLFGYHDQAWALFNTVNIESVSPEIWTVALVGQRMESKSGKEIADWLSREGMRDVPFDYIARHIFMTAVLDRKPDADLITVINGLNLPAGDGRKKSERYRNMYSGFAEALYNVRKGEYERAFIIFKEHEYFVHASEIYESALPYVYLSAVKSGRLTALENDLSKYGSSGDDFAFHLSRAYIYGVKGEHERAMHHLKYASYRIPGTGKRPIFGWYQLVETCEWLYENTKKTEYLSQALKWAKIHQRIQPMFAWAYAVEAKYTNSDADRIKAIALTLYLDRQSESISDFSSSSKSEAMEWFNKNNPFISDPQKKHVIETKAIHGEIFLSFTDSAVSGLEDIFDY